MNAIAQLTVIADVADAVDPTLPKAERDAAEARATAADPALVAEYAVAMLRAVLASVNGWFDEPTAAEQVMRHIRERGGRANLGETP